MALRKSRRITCRFSLKALMLLIVFAAVVLVSWKPLAIALNRYRLGQASRSSDTDSQIMHTKALANLGFYEERKFVFNHLVAGSRESRNLIADLQDLARNSQSNGGPFSLMGGYSPGDIDAITVWATPEQMIQAASIVEAYDIPLE